jgi:iron complex transport system permease protein
MRKLRSHFLVLFLSTILLVALALFALSVGRYPVSIHEILALLFSSHTNSANIIHTIIFNVRIPRILAAILVGAALAVSGTAYQGIFKNPLVSPDILGATAGAGFGAALAIILSLNTFGIQLFSFFFSLLTVALTYMISSRFKKSDTSLILILTGMLAGTLFSSATSLLKYVADPYEKLPTITVWLMGSLARIQMQDIKSILIPFVIGIVPLLLLRWRLNAVAFGDEEAQALGVETTQLRVVIIVSSTILTASVVSIGGIIGWVGLLVPHIARFIVGPIIIYCYQSRYCLEVPICC